MITELKRGKITRMNSSGKPQIEISPGEIYDNIDMYYPAGIYAKPTSGDVLVFFMHGDASLGIAIPCGPFEEIPDIQNDESVIFNPMNGQSYIKFNPLGIELVGQVFINRTGALPRRAIVEGDVDSDGDVIAATV